MRSLGGGPGGSLGFRSLPYGWVWRSACPFHSQKGPRGPVSYRPRGLPARKSPSTVRACSIFFEARLQRVAASRSFLRTRRPPVSAGARRASGRGRPALPDPPSAAGTSPARSSRSRRCLLVRMSSCVCAHSCRTSVQRWMRHPKRKTQRPHHGWTSRPRRRSPCPRPPRPPPAGTSWLVLWKAREELRRGEALWASVRGTSARLEPPGTQEQLPPYFTDGKPDLGGSQECAPNHRTNTRKDGALACILPNCGAWARLPHLPGRSLRGIWGSRAPLHSPLHLLRTLRMPFLE